MKQNYYIFNNGRLKRQENTIFFEKEDGDRSVIPIENTEALYAFGEIDFAQNSLIIWHKRAYPCMYSIIMDFILVVIIQEST